MSFLKDFDELFNNILTDYKNQLPGADISQGSLIFVKSACMASALWGLYKYQEFISKQIFPDTADTENLDHHGTVIGVLRTYNESDASYLSRILDQLRNPRAGGNKNNYEQWALSIDNVAAAYCYPRAQGLGTVDVVMLANADNTGSEIPSSFATISGTNDAVTAGKLMDVGKDFSSVKKGDVVTNTTTGAETTASAEGINGELSLAEDIFTATPQDYSIQSLTQRVWDYISVMQPCNMHPGNLRILPPTIVTQAVTMVVSGSDADMEQISSDIEAYMNGLIPDQTLYLAKLISIAVAGGAETVSITVPSADVVPDPYEMIRPGVISVN